VRNDCKIFRFCRSKCHKHFKAKHNPRKTAWTKAFRAARGKEMTIDKTFEFEKRRNTPVRYDRNLWVKTVRAMQIVERIRSIRKERFQRVRLAGQRKTRIALAHKEISKQADMLKTPVINKTTANIKIKSKTRQMQKTKKNVVKAMDMSK
jgi:large subunit ribosomal protein L24e